MSCIFVLWPQKKNEAYALRSFFIQAAGLVYHHASACISSAHLELYIITAKPCIIPPAAWWDATLRVDDIPQQVADDIHGFRRDLCESSNSYVKTAKISFWIAWGTHRNQIFRRSSRDAKQVERCGPADHEVANGNNFNLKHLIRQPSAATFPHWGRLFWYAVNK